MILEIYVSLLFLTLPKLFFSSSTYNFQHPPIKDIMCKQQQVTLVSCNKCEPYYPSFLPKILRSTLSFLNKRILSSHPQNRETIHNFKSRQHIFLSLRSTIQLHIQWEIQLLKTNQICVQLQYKQTILYTNHAEKAQPTTSNKRTRNPYNLFYFYLLFLLRFEGLLVLFDSQD